MKNEMMIFKNEEMDLKVRTIQNKDGSIGINTEDTAIGFGFTQNKKGKVYVRWETINNYINELGFSQQVGKDDFIPESLFYMLGMKASNNIARKFQMWIATEVLPSIRKCGGYISADATAKQVDNLICKWGSKYCTKEIHDSKSVRKYIREYDKMKLDECINEIVDITTPMKGRIKHNILDTAIKELKKIDNELMKDTIKHTYIKDTACEGIIILQDVKIGKYKRRIITLEQ